MKTFQYIILLLIISALSSCNNAAAKKNELAQDKIAVSATDAELEQVLAEAIVTAEVPQVEGEDTITDIRFKEFSISISRLLIYDADKKLDHIQKDTVEIYAEVGETIENQLISINSELLTGFTVEQRYETSITIVNEGPHCDLIEWRHYDSERNHLKNNLLVQ